MRFLSDIPILVGWSALCFAVLVASIRVRSFPWTKRQKILFTIGYGIFWFFLAWGLYSLVDSLI